MGCLPSKHEKLDLSTSSDGFTAGDGKSNRKAATTKAKKTPPRKQAKSKRTNAKQTATSSAETLIIDSRNDKFNKESIQRSASPPTLKPQTQQQQQTIDGIKSKQIPRPPVQPPTKTTQKFGWTDEQLLSQFQFLDYETSANIVRLFDEGNTIPFICRYRRELINNLDADKYILFTFPRWQHFIKK